MFNSVRKTVFVLSGPILVGLALSACSNIASNGVASSNSGEQQDSMSQLAAVIPLTGELSSIQSQQGALEVQLVAAESQVPYRDETRWAMTYNGEVSGPTIRVKPGDQLKITVDNQLEKPTSLHTHGLHVSPDQDNPTIVIEPGTSYTYTYDIPKNQRAGTYWYHPHIHGLTAEQVSSGLSGAIIVEDSVDTELATLTTDRVLIINDPQLVASNPWSDSDEGMHMGDEGSGVDMMTAMTGRSGPVLLTNGITGVSLEADSEKMERLRVVNASASMSLELTFTGQKMLQLSSEGGRLDQPKTIRSVTLAPGERTEIVLIPSKDGGQLIAQRLSSEGEGAPIADPEVIATIGPKSGVNSADLTSVFIQRNTDLFAKEVVPDATQIISLDGHMNPTINGKLYDPNSIDIKAKKGTVEEWVIRNNTPMAHPMHLHTWSFQVDGEDGWQDVVTVAPNSEQRIRIDFSDYEGTTVFHCHILDHEDTGMMAVINVS